VPRLLLALACGAASVAGFAPMNWFPVPLLSLAVLFRLWDGLPARRAGAVGFAFGLGMFGAGVSWVYVSLHTYGQMPVPLAVLCVTGFVGYLALFPAAVGLLQARLPFSAARMCLAIPALWTLAEWLRGWVLSGFPWLSIGYSQVGAPLEGLAPAGGVYGVTLAAAVTAGALAWLTGRPGRSAWKIALCVVGIWVAGIVASRVEWVTPQAPAVSVALVQGNVPLTRKWVAAERPRILDHYWRLSAGQKESLIVWPEVALPYYREQLAPAFWQRLMEHPSDFVLGLLEREQRGTAFHEYNSVAAVTDRISIYRKQHLVPFGEYLPLKWLFGWVLNYLNIPMSDFSPWLQLQPPLTAAGMKIGVSICYEDAFADEMRDRLPASTVLLNVSEDAWFGDSLAPHQRVQMARMRSLELGRPMLRAANTGWSALIDHHGRIRGIAGGFVTTVLTGAVQPMTGMTPFARFGSWPVVVLCLVLIATALVRRTTRRL